MEKIALWGAIVNALAVFGSASLGTILKHFTGKVKNSETFNKISDTVMVGIGLCVLLVGIQGAIKSEKMTVVILSVVFGGIIGTLIDLDGKINSLGELIGKKISTNSGNISQGFVSATLLFCVGAMAVTGPIQSGIVGDHSIQYIKAILDMITSFVLSLSLGLGVVFSAVSVFVYQGTITLLAEWIQPILNDSMINEMSAVGSLLIIALSLNMIGLTKFKLMNYVPAIFLPILFCVFI